MNNEAKEKMITISIIILISFYVLAAYMVLLLTLATDGNAS